MGLLTHDEFHVDEHGDGEELTVKNAITSVHDWNLRPNPYRPIRLRSNEVVNFTVPKMITILPNTELCDEGTDCVPVK